MLAFARVAGETAPLLFTTLGNQFWNLRVDQPTAALPLQIYTYGLSPYDDWHRQAWAGAFVLIILIVAAVAAVRFAVRHCCEGFQQRSDRDRRFGIHPTRGNYARVRGVERWRPVDIVTAPREIGKDRLG